MKSLKVQLNDLQVLIDSINAIKAKLLKERRCILKQIKNELPIQSVKEQDDDYVPF